MMIFSPLKCSYYQIPKASLLRETNGNQGQLIRKCTQSFDLPILTLLCLPTSCALICTPLYLIAPLTPLHPSWTPLYPLVPLAPHHVPLYFLHSLVPHFILICPLVSYLNLIAPPLHSLEPPFLCPFAPLKPTSPILNLASCKIKTNKVTP